jgi:hypothetical protein
MKRARGYAPFDVSPGNSALLKTMRVLARTRGPGHVAVLDLDGCLFDTRPRQVHIFRECAAHLGLEPLCRVDADCFRDWSLQNAMRNAGLDEAFVAAHHDAVRAFWADRFFRSDYVLHDHAMPGAPAFVRDLHAAGLDLVYLTGRDVSMRPGTEASLRRFAFPLGERATLITKPDATLEDTAFKEAAVETIAGDVVLYLDNEPANVNVFRRLHPHALVVFVETDHSFRDIEPDPEIPWLRTFLT